MTDIAERLKEIKALNEDGWDSGTRLDEAPSAIDALLTEITRLKGWLDAFERYNKEIDGSIYMMMMFHQIRKGEKAEHHFPEHLLKS